MRSLAKFEIYTDESHADKRILNIINLNLIQKCELWMNGVVLTDDYP